MTSGTNSPNVGMLLQVDVPIQPTEMCGKDLEDIGGEIRHKHRVCAGYDGGGCDACAGDSGVL